MAMIALAPVITLATQAPTWVLITQLIVLVPVSAFILTRPDGPRVPKAHE